MAYRKNTKRIDPRYFLHETVDRNDDGSAGESPEGTDPQSSAWDRPAGREVMTPEENRLRIRELEEKIEEVYGQALWARVELEKRLNSLEAQMAEKGEPLDLEEGYPQQIFKQTGI
jgi:hypothetical protein